VEAVKPSDFQLRINRERQPFKRGKGHGDSGIALRSIRLLAATEVFTITTAQNEKLLHNATHRIAFVPHR
jgi:hypothetical protein